MNNSNPDALIAIKNEIVRKAIEEEKLVSGKLLEFEDKNPLFVGQMVDKMFLFGNIWKFIGAFVLYK